MPSQDFVTVFEVSEPLDQMWVEALLEEAGIGYTVANEGVQNLFGAGQVGGFNLATGPIAVRVAAADAARARELIGEYQADGEGDPRWPGELSSSLAEETSSPEAAEAVSRYSRYSLVWGILWLGGIGSVLAVFFGIRAIVATREAGCRTTAKPVLGIVLGLGGILLWLAWWMAALG